MTQIHLMTRVAATPDSCFRLVLDVGTQLSLDTGMRAVGARRDGTLELNDEVTWQARHLGFRWQMTSRITKVERPRLFEDQMVRGPFARWHHVHLFEVDGTGTLMTDSIDFTVPLGIVGLVFDHAVLHRYLTRLLLKRNLRLKAIAEGRYH